MEDCDEGPSSYQVENEKQSRSGGKLSQNTNDEHFSFHLEVYEGDEEEQSGSSDDSSRLDIETENNESTEREKKNMKRKLNKSARSPREKKMKLDESLQEVLLSKIDEEIERQLDSKASKSNLTIANVKHILKQVITNEHVVAMVRHTVNDDETDADYLDSLPGPKLTRSKTKELLAAQPETAWPMTPAKRPGVSSACQALIEQDLPEDSSDEEYQPNEEELTSVGDWEFLSEPATPGAASTPRPPSNLDCSTQTSWTEDGTFRIPAENIGQRTRSKLSLSDTALETIEKAFIPPDITTDMYELNCDDDDDWMEFLNKFTEPLKQNNNETIDDDEEADPEYNLLADEEKENVDKEELRRDRGVKVSKKELNQLVAGLFDMYDEEPVASTSRIVPDLPTEVHNVVYCEMMPPPPLVASVKILPMVPDVIDTRPDEGVMLTLDQRELLAQQMRKHVQLTAQHFVQTYKHPVLSDLAEPAKEQLEAIKNMSNQQEYSMFNAVNLDAALRLVYEWQEKLDVDSDESCEINEFVLVEVEKAIAYRKAGKRYRCRFPTQLLDIVSQSTAIVYPLLLPAFPFRCDALKRPRSLCQSEIHLLAIGLEQFMPYVASQKVFWKRFKLIDSVALINEFLVPVFHISQLVKFVKKEKNIVYEDRINPIKVYYDTGKAPGTDHYVIALTHGDLRPLHLQPPELLPSVWREHVFPQHQTTEYIISAKDPTVPTVVPVPQFQFFTC